MSPHFELHHNSAIFEISCLILRNNKKLLLNYTVEGDSPGTFMTPNSSPVGRVQEISTSIPETHPYDCQRIIPQLLSRIQKLETIVISLLSERVTKVGKNMDHSHLVSNEATCDNEGFRTLIQLSQEDVAYSSTFCLQLICQVPENGRAYRLIYWVWPMGKHRTLKVYIFELAFFHFLH